jgi:hypothetical protein
MPTTTPMPTKNPGDVLTSTLWNTYLRDNLNKLLNQGHRVLTVAQFAALTGLEGTKGVIAPDEVYLEVDSVNGVQWHLAYESGEPTYKWRFLGGPAMFGAVAAAETTTSIAYVDLTTVGPLVVAPRAGDYAIDHGGTLKTNQLGAAAAKGALATVKIGAAAAADTEAVQWNNSGDSGTEQRIGTAFRRLIKTLAASDTVKAQYRGTTAACGMGAQDRSVSITPVRLI